MFNDVKRAYFFAEAKRELYVELPEEDRDPDGEDLVGRLRLSMYGTRDAAQNWSLEYAATLIDLGFKQGLASPCHFFDVKRGLRTAVHGDDFVTVGPKKELAKLRKELEARYDLKTQVLGPDPEEEKEVKMLNRIIQWTDEGISYEPDPRHGEIMIEQLGLREAKGVTTPGLKVRIQDEEEKDKEAMNPEDSTRYRSMVARGNFLAQDRPDLLYAVKEASRSMSTPRHGDWQKIKRIGRYVKHRPRLIQMFRWIEPGDVWGVEAWSDSDWAGCQETRKSSSGGVLQVGGHTVKAYSATQGVIALSSAEAELYALVKAASAATGIASVAKDFGEEMPVRVYADSSAAIGIAFRQGLGKVRHLDVQQLWVQQKILRKELDVKKVLGIDNCADLMTKHLSSSAIEKILTDMGYITIGGRAESAPEMITAKF